MNNRVLTVPNALTFIRLLVLFPIIRALVQVRPWWFLLWVSIGILTDILDGIIARRFNQQSDIGRIADPIIDKLNVLAASAYMTFSSDYIYPLWFFLFILLRELLIMAGSLTLIRNRHVVRESNRPGKNSAFATGIAVLFSGLRLQPYAVILIYIACALTVYSTYIYIRVYVQQVRKSGQNTDQTL